MGNLVVIPISCAQVRQRARRAGSTGPGKCYRLWRVFITMCLSFKGEISANMVLRDCISIEPKLVVEAPRAFFKSLLFISFG
ncbi:hypothetical protein BJ741DRAFT_267257 [Chytriomyces cf. hyalinus JEL632]|nr:hypothetical protein BJ741DRAFT_267257 [Chytriomyces cf. hyalinus JEL632]